MSASAISIAATETRPVALGMISNPASRGNRKWLSSIEAVLADYPSIQHRTTENNAAIAGVLQEFAARSINVLAINGGDGTAAAVLGALLSESPFAELPRVILLPGGTANMSAGDIGMRGKLLPALVRLCKWSQAEHHNDQQLIRSVLRVQPDAQQPASYGMFLGAGIIMQGTEYAHREIHSRGLVDQLSLGLGLLRTIWGWLCHDPAFYQPTRLSFTLDACAPTAEQDTVLLLVSSLHRLFLGIRPYWGTEPGTLKLSIIRDQAQHLLRALPAVLRGKPNRFVRPECGYLSHNAQRIELHMDGSYNLDGEIFHARRAAGPVIISNAGDVSFIKI